jgi:phosphatidylserine decarboxylase
VTVEGRRNPFVAREGLPFLLVTAIAFAMAVRYLDLFFGALAAFLFLVLYLLFRDPHRDVPPSPLGVVSPVDGKVVAVDRVTQGILQGEAHRIRIEIDSFGTYTARAPVEGKIMDLHAVAADKSVNYEPNALWVQTDEGDDVVLQFTGYRFGLVPRSFIRFGERVGQGQRFAYLRLTRFADVHLPITSTVLVDPGESVIAGSALIGKVPHP